MHITTDPRTADRPAAGPAAGRAGFTLIELVVVILIVAILMAVTIPVVRTGIKERARRESARQINTLLSAARSEATGTGRPHGVWIERSRIDADAAFQLYTTEVPPAFCGESTSSVGFVTRSVRRAPGDPPLPGETPYIRVWFASSYGYTSGATPVPYLNPDMTASQLITAGDRIRFVGPGTTYRVTATGTTTRPRSATDTTPVSLVYADLQTVVYSDPPLGLGLKPRVIDTLPRPGTVPNYPGTVEELIGGRPLPYMADRSPIRLTASSLELPPETVIDLGLSGMTPDGKEFLSQGGPVIIMFTPQGTVEELLVGNQTKPVITPIYLHVGRADQTFLYSDATPAVNANFLDGTNSWVMINNANGTVVTAANQIEDVDGNGTVSMLEARMLARQQLLSSQ